MNNQAHAKTKADVCRRRLKRHCLPHRTWFTPIALSLLVVVSAMCNRFVSDEAHARAQGGAVPTVQIGHSDFIYSVRFSPDGSMALSLGIEGTAKLWDVATGRLIRTFSLSGSKLEKVGFSPDGTRVIASSDMSEGVTIWDAESGRSIINIKQDIAFTTFIAVSPDGRAVLTSNVDDLHLWDTEKGTLIRKVGIQDGSDHFGAFSAKGNQAIIASEFGETVKIWDVAKGRLLSSAKRPAGTVHAATFGPDGPRVVVAGEDGDRASVVNARTGRVLRTIELGRRIITALTLSPDGRRVGVGFFEEVDGKEAHGIHIYDARSGRRIRAFTSVKPHVFPIAFSPDGRRIAAVLESESLSVWDIDSGALLRDFRGTQAPLHQVSVSADGKRIAGMGGLQEWLNLWDTTTGHHIRAIKGHDGYVDTGLFSSPPAHVFSGSGDETAKLWNAETGRLIRTFKGHSDRIGALAVSRDGKRLLTGSWDKTVKLWDVASGRLLRTFEGHSKRIHALAFAPDGKRFVSSSEDETIRLWDVATGTLVRELKGHHLSVLSVAYAPDGRLIATGGQDDRIRFWDAETGQNVRTIESLRGVVKGWENGIIFSTEGHSEYINSIAFSPDGTLLLSGSDDQTIKLWDVGRARLIRTFEGQTTDVTSVAFLGDGKRIASASGDGIRIWDRQSGRLLVTLTKFAEGEWMAITPEGYFAASKNGAKKLILVRGYETYSIDQFYQRLYRPDLVREKLAGDPTGKVREAAAKLDLDKIFNSGTAPEVTIVGSGDGTKVTDDRFTAKAKVSDQGGGIGRIEWRVNGLTLGVQTKRGLDRIAKGQADKKALTLQQDVWLEPGKNVIEVVAYNARNLMASEPARITVTWDGRSSKTPPRLHVLAVGINNYFDSRLKLNYAVPDAKAFGAALSGAGGGLYEKVSVTTVLDDDATAKGLEATFADLAGKVRPRDVFVFFLAGHGKTVDGRYYFIPQDFRYRSAQSIVNKGIGQDQWQRWFSKIPARKSILLYDTCESGSLTGARIATRGLERVAALEKLTRAMGRTVLSAATDDAPALEGYRGHGVFTYALLDALSGSDTNQNGLIEITELAGHVDARVPEISQSAFGQRQLPQMNIVGSNFPLAKRTAAVRDRPSKTQSPVISKKPTHVVIKPTGLFQKAGGDGQAATKLKPGTMVTLVRTEDGWTLIAKDGKQLGFVADGSLAQAQ